MRYFFYSYTFQRRDGQIGPGRRFVKNERFPTISALEKLTIEYDNMKVESSAEMLENVTITNIFEFQNEEDFNNASQTK